MYEKDKAVFRLNGGACLVSQLGRSLYKLACSSAGLQISSHSMIGDGATGRGVASLWNKDIHTM